MQATKDGAKEGSKEIEALVLDDISAHVEELMEPGIRYIMGSGSTVAAIMNYLDLKNTLLGVDVIEDGQSGCQRCYSATVASFMQAPFSTAFHYSNWGPGARVRSG